MSVSPSFGSIRPFRRVGLSRDASRPPRARRPECHLKRGCPSQWAGIDIGIDKLKGRVGMGASQFLQKWLAIGRCREWRILLFRGVTPAAHGRSNADSAHVSLSRVRIPETAR